MVRSTPHFFSPRTEPALGVAISPRVGTPRTPTTTRMKGSNSMILRKYGIENKKDLYNMSIAPGTNMKTLAGQRIQITGYLLTEDADRTTGEMKKTLRVLDTDGKVIGTTSSAFIEGFEKYLEFMDTDVVESFEVGKKLSKQGREYIVFIA